MGYLITQIVVCLLVAAVIGLIIGWMLRGLSANRRENHLKKECERKIKKLRDEWSSATTIATVSTNSSTGEPLAATAGSNPVYTDDDITVVKLSDDAAAALDPVSHPIEKIEGIGNSIGTHLRTIPIKTTHDLIKKCSIPSGVQEVASAAKVEGSVVREWVRMAELMEIPNVNGKIAELLEASGIKSILDLANEDAQHLVSKMQVVNHREHRIPDSQALPAPDAVAKWISAANILATRI